MGESTRGFDWRDDAAGALRAVVRERGDLTGRVVDSGWFFKN
jgi:hypothetical protein